MSSLAVHRAMDASCRYVVVAATFVVAVTLSSPTAESIAVPAVVASAVLTAALGKLVKALVNQARPASSRKADPGMPSSHAVALSYLSVAAALGLQRWWQRAAETSSPSSFSSAAVAAAAGSVLALGAYWACLRVVLGHHSRAQVAVGYALGASCACGVFAALFVGYDGEKPGGRIDELPRPVRVAALAAFVALCFAALGRVGGRWIREDFSPAAAPPTARRRAK